MTLWHSLPRLRRLSLLAMFATTLAATPALARQSPPPLISVNHWGSDRSGLDRLDVPLGIARGPSSLFVADSDNNRVLEYTLDGTLLRQFATSTQIGFVADVVVDGADVFVHEGAAVSRYNTAGTLQSFWPLDEDFNNFSWKLAVAGNEVFASIESSGEIVVFDRNGQRLRAWSLPPGPNGARAVPLGIAVAANGNVFVADAGNRRLLRFDRNGAAGVILAGEGSGNTNVASPWDVELAPNGNLLVGDFPSGGFQLKEIAPDGTLIRSLLAENNGVADNQTLEPVGIAVDGSHIHLVDDLLDRVQTFTTSGAFVRTWGQGSTAAGELHGPSGITIDPDNNVVVSDRWLGRLQRFTIGGDPLAVLGDFGVAPGNFRFARGVASDQHGNLWVADTGNQRIQKLDHDGTLLLSVGSQGSAPGQFSSPSGIAVAPDGTVFVTDTSNHRVQRFDSSGNFLNEWGARGTSSGQFNTPWALAIDATGNVFVGDNTARIQKFTPTGALLQVIATPSNQSIGSVRTLAFDDRGILHGVGSSRVGRFAPNGTLLDRAGQGGYGLGQIYSTQGIAIDPAGRLFISSSGNDRIEQVVIPCVPGPYTLCLHNGRFKVEVDWQNQYNGTRGLGLAIPTAAAGSNALTGYFGFDTAENVELILKVLDFGSAIKVFYSQLTDLGFQLYITDTTTGKRELYEPTPGNCGAIDQDALKHGRLRPRLLRRIKKNLFATGTCAPTATTLCLLNSRFAASLTWRNPYLPAGSPGSSGIGQAKPLTNLTGQFTFDNPSNVELLVKTLDFGNEDILVLYGSLSDFEYSLTVIDTTTGRSRVFDNAAGNYCGGSDRDAF